MREAGFFKRIEHDKSRSLAGAQQRSRSRVPRKVRQHCHCLCDVLPPPPSWADWKRGAFERRKCATLRSSCTRKIEALVHQKQHDDIVYDECYSYDVQAGYTLWVRTFGQVGCNKIANKAIVKLPTFTVYRLNHTVSWLWLARQTRPHTWAGLEHPRESRWKAVRAFSPRSPSSFFPWSHFMALFKSEKAAGFRTPAGPLSCLSAPNSCSETARNAVGHGLQANKRPPVPKSLLPGSRI